MSDKGEENYCDRPGAYKYHKYVIYVRVVCEAREGVEINLYTNVNLTRLGFPLFFERGEKGSLFFKRGEWGGKRKAHNKRSFTSHMEVFTVIMFCLRTITH